MKKTPESRKKISPFLAGGVGVFCFLIFLKKKKLESLHKSENLSFSARRLQ
jgi:hypothetical protein